MNQKIFALGLGALLSVISFPAHAQKEAPIPRVGILKAGASPRNGSPDVFVLALRDLGYIENKNIVFDIRYADGDRGRLREFAKEMVQLKPDAIFTATSAAMFALKEATKTIPIVIVSSTDPVEAGLVASLARPGGNITGMSLIATDLWPKRLELLKEIFPQVSKIAMFWNKSNTGMAVEAKATREAAGPMGVTLQDRGVKDANEIDGVFEAMTRDKPDAFLALMDVTLRVHRNRILEFLERNRIPAIYESKDWVDTGGLMSYGADSAAVTRRAAVQMDKILKGAKPADLPIEQPTKFELVINLKTAKQIGLTIPPNVLARADRVIK